MKIKILLVAAVLQYIFIAFVPPATTHAALFTDASMCNASVPSNLKVKKQGYKTNKEDRYGEHWKTKAEVGYDHVTWTPAPEKNNACAAHRFFGIYVDGKFVYYQKHSTFDTNLAYVLSSLRRHDYQVTTVFLASDAKTLLLEGSKTNVVSTK